MRTTLFMDGDLLQELSTLAVPCKDGSRRDFYAKWQAKNEGLGR